MSKIFRTLVFYPLLFGILPVFVLYTGNLRNVAFSITYRSFMVTFGITAVLFVVMRLVLRDWARAGLVVTFLIFFFLNFIQLTFLLNDLFSLFKVTQIQISTAIVVSIIILGLWAILRIIRKPRAFTPALNFISASMLLINLSMIGIYSLQQLLFNPEKQAEDSFVTIDPGSLSAHESKRDIYYIILDGYTRSDILQELYGLDNHSFLNNLESKGFYIADESHSNYSQTVLSLSSSLNMQYVDKLVSLDPKSDRGPLINLIKNSQVRRFLEEQGYQIVAFDSGFDGTNITDADVFIKRNNKINIFEYLMINNSLAFLGVDSIVKPRQYAAMIDQFNQLDKVANLSGPKFVFVHFLVTHPPFLIDRNGDMQQKYSAAIGDGSDFKGSKDDYRDGYREQLLYANQRIEEIVDHILSSSDPEPIIIIQGDHGSGLYLENDSFEKTCIRERLSILNAYYLPGKGGADLYSKITPVNSFRVILNAYFDTDLPLLKDDSYYSTFGMPFTFHKVSEDQLTQPCTTVLSRH